MCKFGNSRRGLDAAIKKPRFARHVAVVWILAAALTLEGPARGAAEGEGHDVRLEQLLNRLDKVAALYRDSALRFSCHERITYHPGTPDIRVYDLEYMYVYDKAKGLLDYRNEIRAGRRKNKPPREVSLAELDLPAVVLRAYSAIFIFERSKKDSYRYAIVRDEKVLGRNAVVIRFEAIPPYKPDYNDLFGLAWVDLETSQLLKVDALKADQHELRQQLEADLAGHSAGTGRRDQDYIIQRILSEFSVEHNGMRFPSRVVIRRSHFEVTERDGVRTAVEREIFWIEQTYSKYSFYGVRAHEQIRDFVSGGATLGDHP